MFGKQCWPVSPDPKTDQMFWEVNEKDNMNTHRKFENTERLLSRFGNTN